MSDQRSVEYVIVDNRGGPEEGLMTGGAILGPYTDVYVAPSIEEIREQFPNARHHDEISLGEEIREPIIYDAEWLNKTGEGDE